MIQNVEDLTEACRILIDKANERGGEDNITVVIARFDGEALHSATESGSITGSFRDRKSTRLNSSHLVISYAVFCLKKKKNPIYTVEQPINFTLENARDYEKRKIGLEHAHQPTHYSDTTILPKCAHRIPNDHTAPTA